MKPFSDSMDIDDCNDCPSGESISDVPTPSSRSNAFLHAFPPYSGRSSVHGSVSSSINVPTPYAAYPTATASPRSSRAYSGSSLPQIGRTFSAQLWNAFQSGNTITTVLEDASGYWSTTNSTAVSRHLETPPSCQVSPTSESEDPREHRAYSSASLQLVSTRPDISLFSRRTTLPVLPSSSWVSPSLFPSHSIEPKELSSQLSVDGQTIPSTSIHSTDLDTLEEILEKGYPKSANIPKIGFLRGQREMVRTMYLDNIRHATARLHKHQWILERQMSITRVCVGWIDWI